MTKKKLASFIILFMSSLLIMGACSSKSDPYARFSKEEQKFSWLGDRNRSFGNSDYYDVSKQEALKTVKDKYGLGIPEYYTYATEILESNMFSEQPKYDVLARGDELKFLTKYTYVQDNELFLVGNIVLNYERLSNAEQVRLKEVYLEIKAVDFPKEKLSRLVKESGKMQGFSKEKITDALSGYEKQLKESKEPMNDKVITLLTNNVGLNEQEEFSKSIKLVYGKTGRLEMFEASIVDLIK